jgi:hypothetical protein
LKLIKHGFGLFAVLRCPVEALGEALYTTCRVENFVVTRKEGVTSVTDIRTDFRRACASLELVSTSTGYGAINIVWVDIFFHVRFAEEAEEMGGVGSG